eukprot:TRINITY_DN9057_c0_g1_i1.p1 TRINITY_DN9057_c0_g1~~TRINITY_DN9057_c0_g1_i1.p1  ORF type:complete len:1421 (+),score=180.76 TRINITY_DN9057_c0_g1_i1:80-4342(+)
MLGLRRSCCIALALFAAPPLPAALAEFHLGSCGRQPGGFDVNFNGQESPCPANKVLGYAPGGGSLSVFACGDGGVYVCRSSSLGSICSELAGNKFAGCTAPVIGGTAVYDVAIDSGAGLLYTMCGHGVARCFWHEGNSSATGCSVDPSLICPGAIRGRGVALSPTNSSTLLYACYSTTSAVDRNAGVYQCTVTHPGTSGPVASGCRRVADPCDVVRWSNASGARNMALGFDNRGSISVGCNYEPSDAVVCDYDSFLGPRRCVSASGSIGAIPCSSYTFGVFQMPTGETGVACAADGWYICARPPTGSPSVAPSSSPVYPTLPPSRSPTTAPTAAPTGPPTDQSGAPTYPSPTGAPSLSPSPVRYSCRSTGGSQLCTPGGAWGAFDRPDCSGMCAGAPAPPPLPPPAPAPPPPPPVPPTAVPSGGPASTAPTVPPSAAPSGPPTIAPSRAPSSAPAAPSSSPSLPPTAPPTGAPSSGVCSAVTCRGVTDCRGGSSCVPLLSGTAFCTVGAAAPDGASCDDGRPETTGDVCSSGACFGLPLGCELTPECRTGFDPQCGALVCSDGACRRVHLDDGRECDDHDNATVRDACRKGVCGGVDLCLGVLCGGAEQCRERGRCRSTDGRCVQRLRPDGTACRNYNIAVASDECVTGQCVSFFTSRVAEMLFSDESGPVEPVTAFSPGTPLSPPRSACDAVDKDSFTEWVDRRVKPVQPADLDALRSHDEVALDSNWGDLILVFPRPVALAAVGVLDSATNPAQAPTQLEVSGCILSATAAAEVHRTAGGAACGSLVSQTALDHLGDSLRDVSWMELPAVRAPVQPEGMSREFTVGPAEPHLCYRLRPVALRSGCGSDCADGGSVVPTAATVGAGALVLLAAGGLLLGALVGRRLKANDSEPPPLTGKDVAEVLQKCSDAWEPLAARWRRSSRSLSEEMIARAVVPAPGGPALALDCLRKLLKQPWRSELSLQLAQLPSPVLAALRLYSQEPQDVDREMLWPDAPPPGLDSSGHGLQKKADKEAWQQYTAAHAATDGARNKSHYRMPNRASFELCRTHRWSSLNKYEDWVKYVAALTWAASASRPDQAAPVATLSPNATVTGTLGEMRRFFSGWASELSATLCSSAPAGKGDLFLIRMLGSLPVSVRQGYSSLKPGMYFALPCLSSTSTAPEADADFMGTQPGSAVLLRLRFAPGRELGVDMRTISMYPQEAEVLLPMFTVFRVTAVRRPRRLAGAVALGQVSGCSATFSRALLHVRCLVRPLLVVEAECVGGLQQLDPEAAKWLDEVAADARRSEKHLEPGEPPASLGDGVAQASCLSRGVGALVSPVSAPLSPPRQTATPQPPRGTVGTATHHRGQPLSPSPQGLVGPPARPLLLSPRTPCPLLAPQLQGGAIAQQQSLQPRPPAPRHTQAKLPVVAAAASGSTSL